MEAIKIKEVFATDPDTGDEVELEIFKDPISGGMFAIDSSFLDQVIGESGLIKSPFNPDYFLIIPEEKTVSFFILSPDGFPFHPDPITCKENELEEVAESKADQIIERYRQQGYYSTTNRERIPFNDIKEACRLKMLD